MQSGPQVAPVSKGLLWTGRIISALPILLLAFSAIMKFVNPPDMKPGFEHLGWPIKLALALGIIELSCTILYAIPQTAVLGAILLTGYMGGAIATHLRIGEPYYTQAAVGVLVWLGLFLREPRLRSLIPLRTRSSIPASS